MARTVLLAGVVLATAVGAVGPAAAKQAPILRSARIVHRHPVVKIAVADVRPLELLVARHRAVDGAGALLQKNIRLEETIDVSSSPSGVVRWRSPKALRR